jgi:hypothetical protein
MKGDYGTTPVGGVEENKAKQTQFHTPGSDSIFEFEEKCF